jgi:glycosyltransferase involved in cell wall biosynthesis
MTDVMRILFLIPRGASSHSMIFVRRQAEAITGQGFQVDLFELGSRTSPRLIWSEFRRFRRILRTYRPQVIHAHYGTVTAAFAALGAGGIPLVITFRGSDLNGAPSAWRLREAAGRVLSQIAALRAARTVCVSRQLRNLLWWRRTQVAVLPTGTDPEVFRPQPRERLRIDLGWREEERVVLFNAGSDPQNKRLDLARSAVMEAKRWTPGVRLEVLDGSTEPSRVPALMNAADCLLVTSDSEGSPAIVQEGLATNLPVVSVDVGDIAERLRGVTGSSIAGRDPQALGRALANVLNPPRRSDGRRKVEEFSSMRVARELAQIYREVAGEQSR